MKIKWQTILIVAGVFLAIVLLIDFNRRLEELNTLEANQEAIQAEGTAIMQTQVALVTQVAYATSDEAVAQWAYENKWIRQGEQSIGLVPADDATATPEPVVGVQVEHLPTWRIWWELFFGDSK